MSVFSKPTYYSLFSSYTPFYPNYHPHIFLLTMTNPRSAILSFIYHRVLNRRSKMFSKNYCKDKAYIYSINFPRWCWLYSEGKGDIAGSSPQTYRLSMALHTCEMFSTKGRLLSALSWICRSSYCILLALPSTKSYRKSRTPTHSTALYTLFE